VRTCLRSLAAVAAVLGATLARADPPSATSTSPASQEQSAANAASTADPRLVFSGQGSWLSEDHGGGGGSVTWLRNFGAGDVLGLGAEYQTIANSHWTLGNFNGSLAAGQGALKSILYAEAHEGSGDTAGSPFHYNVVAGGLINSPSSWFTWQLEYRYIDIQPSHGNLPKLALSFRLGTPLLASVAYAQSFGGNLGTKLGTARLDYVGKRFNWLIGAAYGPVSPAVLNIIGQQVAAARTLKEGFIGAGKTLGRADWQLVADYQDLEGFKRTTLTLNCTWHLSGH
jgi:hypothetical protein